METIWSLVVAACSVVLGTGLGWWVSTKNTERQWRREDQQRRYDRTDAAVQLLFLESQVLMRSVEDADGVEDARTRLLDGGSLDRFLRAQQMVIARGSASHPGLVATIKSLVDLLGQNPETLHRHALTIEFVAAGWFEDDQKFEPKGWPGWRTLGVVEKLMDG